MDDTKYSTNVIHGKCQSPEFHYEKLHHVECVTKFLIDYLKEDKLTVKIFGNQDPKKKKVEKQQPKSNQSSANRRSSKMNLDNRSGTTSSTMDSSNTSLRVNKVSRGFDPLGGGLK
jgi:hypothetical protein